MRNIVDAVSTMHRVSQSIDEHIEIHSELPFVDQRPQTRHFHEIQPFFLLVSNFGWMLANWRPCIRTPAPVTHLLDSPLRRGSSPPGSTKEPHRDWAASTRQDRRSLSAGQNGHLRNF